MARALRLLGWLAASGLAVRGSELSFLAIGDWGGSSDRHPTTHGEVCTASGMGRVAGKLNASFVLGLGDNFYSDGIHSDNQNRLSSTFDRVFTDPNLDVEWWFIAGNHDHLGHISYQIDFSKKLARWKYPAPYYTFKKSLPSGKVAEFVMFDSVSIAGLSYRDETTGQFVAAPGPANVTEAQTQWAWLEAQLASSTADYLFTVGHYPVWSACDHGPNKDMVAQLRPMLKAHGVTAHLAGHDHCLQHITEGNLAFVLSGAGARDWYDLSREHDLSEATLDWHMASDNAGDHVGGFAAITLTDDEATVRYYAEDAALLYTAASIPPRRRSAELEVSV